MKPLIEVQGLVKHYPVGSRLAPGGRRMLKAVDGIDLTVMPGETLGLVGESGCGKSTAARLITRLLEPTAGSIIFNGQDISRLNTWQLKPIRRRMQIVFQNPFASLNPRKKVERLIMDPLLIHGIGDADQRRARVQELLELVGLHPSHANRYPHEFSGGQRQRISIARALACGPDLIVADEPVSALDVSIQAQVINLLQDLQRDLALTLLFISHDLSVVQYVSDRIAVMYLGKVVEIGPSEAIYAQPRHPYTQSLLNAIPIPDPQRKLAPVTIEAELPSPMDVPGGCRFHPRCPIATELCRREAPVLRQVGQQMAACHHA